ncbi:unnamed protein product [Hymenolepis diminuta]|uniref:Uncharacterized protein n=1 Tax=Hymenolepis diminuta TaxID=6216 RepID=A0A564YXP5_HYMDI|nr:unnamed protein product [Hymenolepis diminuta]
MSMKTDVLSHIEQQIDELRHIYENIKAEHFPFGNIKVGNLMYFLISVDISHIYPDLGAITDTSPSPSPTTNYSDVNYPS